MEQKHTVIAIIHLKVHQALQHNLPLLALAVCLAEGYQVKA